MTKSNKLAFRRLVLALGRVDGIDVYEWGNNGVGIDASLNAFHAFAEDLTRDQNLWLSKHMHDVCVDSDRGTVSFCLDATRVRTNFG